MIELPLLTHSSSQCAATCMRKYFFRYELGIVPADERDATHRGTLLHKCFEMADIGHTDAEIATYVRGHAKTQYTAELVLAMWSAHVWYYQNDKFNVVKAEFQFRLPIVDPTTGAVDEHFQNAGKSDRIIKLGDGRFAYQEYKSTARDVSVGSKYWAKLRLDSQVSRYMRAAQASGIPVETVVYDVIRWPSIRPLMATMPEARRYTKEGKLYASQRLLDETPIEYAARATEQVVACPSDFLIRQEISRTEDDLREFDQELADQATAIAFARERNLWVRNTNVCLEPFECDYLHICADRAWLNVDPSTPPPAGMRWGEKHPELESPTNGD